MRSIRRHARAEMGEAINFEDVLTVIAVLLLLRLIFMVPLVNLDKAKTVAARSDAYWNEQARWMLSHSGDSVQAAPYRAAFQLEGKSLNYVAAGPRSIFLEAASPDSNMLVLRHNVVTGNFVAMNVQGRSHSLSFRRGKLIWSTAEKEWFPASDSVDYGSEVSKAMEKEFREWTKAHRGY
jgi:hypothetical protein